MKFVIDLALRRFSVVEHRSAKSEDMRFDFSWGLRNFLCPTLVTRRKTSFSVSLPSSKLTIPLILTLFVRKSDNYTPMNIVVPVVRRSDDAIHRINLYPEDNARRFAIIYLLDSDLSVG